MFLSATSLALPQLAYQAQARAGMAPETAARQGSAPKAAAAAAGSAPAQSPPAAQLAAQMDPRQVAGARQWLSAEVADFAAEVGNKFRESGLSREGEPMLAVNADGEVTVVNDTPDRWGIERLFARDGELSQRFSTLATTAETVQAADAQQDFQARYAALGQDAKAQQALVAEERARNSGGLRFHLVLTPSGPEYFFPGVLRASA